MNHGSLFSGIGGFDLAAEWMGWTNVFHCEWMPFPRKVLDYYFPNADSHIDICSTDFTKYANKIDILTGGFPCQPFSMAGKRKGTSDERYLWGEMLRAIQEIKPKFVIAENVFGITNIDGGLVFEKVCLDLEAEGYEVQPFIIPAAAKNAPHRRDRVWFVASSNTNRRRLERSIEVGWDSQHVIRENSIDAQKSNATYSNSIRQHECERNNEKQSSERGEHALNDIEQNALHTDSANNKTFIQGSILEQSHQERQTGRFSNASASSNWIHFPTQSPICSGDDGLPTELDGITFSKWRAESIKGYGNAIVPQVAYELFTQIQKLNDTISQIS